MDEDGQHCPAIFLSANHQELARDEEKEILNCRLFIKNRILCVSDQVSTQYMYNLRVFFVVDSFIEKGLQLTQNFMVVIGFDSNPTPNSCLPEKHKTSPALFNSIFIAGFTNQVNIW